MRRSTGDLLVLMVAATVCAVILLTGAAFLIVAVARPETDLSRGVSALSGVVSTLTGIIAGYLAGRTARRERGDE